MITKGHLTEPLRGLPEKVQRLLYEEDEFARCGKYLAGFEHAYLVARGINYPVALEGALKLKEIKARGPLSLLWLRREMTR